LPTVARHPQALASGNVSQIEALVKLGKGRANGLAWTPDGQLLAVSSSSSIDLYGGETLALQSSLSTGAGLLAFHPNGNFLATPARGGIAVWSLTQQAVYQRLSSQLVAIYDLAFSPDGRWLAAVGQDELGYEMSEHGVEVWDLSTGQSQYTLATGLAPFDLDISPDSTRLAVATYLGATIVDLPTGQVVQRLDSEGDQLEFMPDGQTVLAARGTWLVLYDLATGRVLDELKNVSNFTLSPDGRSVLVYNGIFDGRQVSVGDQWTLPSGEVLSLYPLRGTAAAFRPDSARYAVISGDVELHALNQEQPLGRLAYTTAALAVDFLPPTGSDIGPRLLGGYQDGRVIQWDVLAGTREVEYASPGRAVSALAVSPSGQWVAAGTEYSGINLYAVGNAAPVQSFDCQDRYLRSLRFSPDETLLGAACDGFQFWRISDGQPVELDRDGWWLLGGTGQPLFAMDEDDGWRLVDVATGQASLTYLMPLAPYIDEVVDWAVSPDGRFVAMGSTSGYVMVWSADAPEVLHVFEAHESFGFDGGSAGVKAVAFSPVCCLLASAGYAGDVRLWDAETGAALVILTDANGTVTDLAFSPDGRWLAASVYDGTLRVWGLTAP
jgi:WD40 repeat protein